MTEEERLTNAIKGRCRDTRGKTKRQRIRYRKEETLEGK